MSLLVLTAADVERITLSFSPQYLQSLMADVFALVSSSTSDTDPPKSYMPHRITVPTENHIALFMPARIGSLGTTMKVVSIPTNPDDKRGLPGSTLVLDKDSGAVKAVVNARNLTALRNAAGSLLSTTLVGPVAPQHIVAFGAGRQIFANLDLHFQAFKTIRTCTIVNRSLNDRVSTVIDRLKAKHPSISINCLASTPPLGGFTSEPTTDAQKELRAALAEASIIITATPSRAPLFPSSWARSGAHVVLIGSYTPAMREVDRDLIMRAVQINPSRVTIGGRGPVLLIDSLSACFTEAGEILDAELNSEQLVEIGKMVIDERENGTQRRHEDSPLGDFEGPITLFKSVGVGLQDVAIACAVVDKAEEIRLKSDNPAPGILVDGFD